MILVNPVTLPDGAALLGVWGRKIMDVILHLGAHRTATTSFQDYIRQQSDWLESRKIGFWGPRRTRKSVFPGLFRTIAVTPRRHQARRAEGRVQMQSAQAEARGIKHLLVSDENMMGSCAQNLRLAQLYPAVGDRLARVAAAFDGRVAGVVLTVRAQDLWWASAAALAVSRGHAAPDAARCAAIAGSARSWRDVITDIACAVPDVPLRVMPFETYAGRPDLVLGTGLGAMAPRGRVRWLNRSPDLRDLRCHLMALGKDPALLGPGEGRYTPFDRDQSAALRENYADDLHWLTAGADGLAQLTEHNPRTRAGSSLPLGQMTKGQTYDIGQGYLA